MHLTGKLNEKIQNTKIQLLIIYYAFQHPKTGILPKLIVAFALGYALSPIDLIPDFIPVIGLLDDLVIIPALISLGLKLIPEEILAECRIKANNQPVKLKDNWIFASIIILIWIALLFIIIRTIIQNVSGK